MAFTITRPASGTASSESSCDMYDLVCLFHFSHLCLIHEPIPDTRPRIARVAGEISHRFSCLESREALLLLPDNLKLHVSNSRIAPTDCCINNWRLYASIGQYCTVNISLLISKYSINILTVQYIIVLM